MSDGAATPDKTESNSWSRFRGAGLLPRLGVAALGIPVLVGTALSGGLFFQGLVTFVILLGLREYYQLSAARGYGPFRILGTLAGVALSVVMVLAPRAESAVLTLIVMVVASAELFRSKPERALAHVGVTLLGIFYVAWLGTHLVLLRNWTGAEGAADAGLQALGLAVLCTWCCDTFAFLVGVAIGRHPLLLHVSPKKSREGAVAGLLAAGGGGALCVHFFAGDLLSLGEGVWIGLLVGVFAQVGDLVESLLKRDAGLKDTAGLLPGHGGVLDRFDSLFFTAPLVYYILALGLAGGP